MIDLTIFYAAVVAVENGELGEIEIADQTETDGKLTMLRVTIRREVQTLESGGVE